MIVRNRLLLICLLVALLFDGQTLSAQLEADSWSNRWDIHTPMPGPRKFHGSCVVGKKIYVLGGFNQHFTWVSNLLVYNTETDTWDQLPVSPQFHRLYISLFNIKDKIYALGGAAKVAEENFYDHTFFSVDVYDPVSNSWQARSNIPVDNLGPSCVLNNYIYVIGGQNAEIGPIKRTLRYDIQNDVWERMADMNKGRIHHGVVSHKGKIYAICGITEPIVHLYGNPGDPSVEVYDPDTDSWSFAPTRLPVGLVRLRNMVVSIGNDILTFGGQYKGSNTNAHKYIYRLNGLTDKWELFDSMPGPRGLTAVERIEEIIYIIGGTGLIWNSTVQSTLSYNISHMLPAQKDPEQLFLYPNPAKAHTQIKFTASKPTEVRVSICTSMGQVVKHIESTSLPVGQHELPVDLSDLENGIYFVNVITDCVTSQLLIIE